jgi:hypothetical protein
MSHDGHDAVDLDIGFRETDARCLCGAREEQTSVAIQMTDVESKNAVLEIAAECDKLCRRAEDRAKTLGGNALSAVAAPPVRTV